MPWQTPKTDWVITDIDYDHEDLNRVEDNTLYLKQLFKEIGYTATFTPGTVWSPNNCLIYAEDWERIEQNIKNIADASYTPSLNWETPKTNWTAILDSFDYTSANRLEKNLETLYQQYQNILSAYIYCGDPLTICGKGNTLF